MSKRDCNVIVKPLVRMRLELNRISPRFRGKLGPPHEWRTPYKEPYSSRNAGQ